MLVTHLARRAAGNKIDPNMVLWYKEVLKDRLLTMMVGIEEYCLREFARNIELNTS